MARLEMRAAIGEALVVETACEPKTIEAEKASALADASSHAPEDLAVARRCLNGDGEAQRIFAERYTGLVCSVCRRRGLPRDAAEDVTQDVFCEVFASLRRYRGDARLSSWLFVIATRHVARYRRSPARRLVATGQTGDEVLAAASIHRENETELRYLAGERKRRVNDAIAGLTEPMRSVILAYYLGEMSVAQIARMLDMAEGTVKSHLHRARRAMRAELEAIS